MIEGLNTQNNSDNSSVSDVGTVNNVDSVANTTSQTSIETQTEKSLSQNEVNEIVKNEKKRAYEKGLEAAKKEFYENSVKFSSIPPQQQQIQQAQQPTNTPQSTGNNVTSDTIRAEINKIQQEAWAYQTANQFINKINTAKSKYPDIEQTIEKLNLPQNVNIIHFANNLDNTADVLYELAKNPAKYATVLNLAASAPKAAADAMFELSQSIKQNEEAKAKGAAPKPDSQLNHSNIGIDSGTKSIANISKSSWIKKFC